VRLGVFVWALGGKGMQGGLKYQRSQGSEQLPQQALQRHLVCAQE
jgi:hypothetical protein